MTLTSHQWTLAFVAALALHAPPVVLLPQGLFSRRSDPPPPQPVLIVLAASPAPPTPVVTPPQPPRPAPPVVTPQTAPVPAITRPTLSTQPSAVAAVDPTPVPTPQVAPTPTLEIPVETTTAVAPTPVLNVVDLDQLKRQYGNTAQQWLSKFMRYPRRAEYRGDEGIVLVRLVVNRDGEILESSLEDRSGNNLLDREAEAMIRRAGYLPVLPESLAEAIGGTITIRVPIEFELR